MTRVMQDAVELKSFLHSPKPMLLIIGKTGGHKTPLLPKAISFSDPNHMVLRLKGRPNLQPAILTTLLSKHWAIQATKSIDDESHETLDHMLNCLYAQNQTCLLLVEQAHLLPVSILTALCHLSQQQENKTVRIRMILVGYPELISKIHALYSKKFSHPHIIYLSTLKNSHKKWDRYRQTPQIKIIAAFLLIMSGFLWWKTEENRVLLHAHLSIQNQTEPKQSQTSLT